MPKSREVKLPNPEDLVTECLNFGTTYKHTRKQVADVVFRCAMCGWELDQIGALMNVSPETLKKQYHRAYERGKLILQGMTGHALTINTLEGKTVDVIWASKNRLGYQDKGQPPPKKVEDERQVARTLEHLFGTSEPTGDTSEPMGGASEPTGGPPAAEPPPGASGAGE